MSIPTPWNAVRHHLEAMARIPEEAGRTTLASALADMLETRALHPRQFRFAKAELQAYQRGASTLTLAAMADGAFPAHLDPLNFGHRQIFEIEFVSWLAGFSDGADLPWAAGGRRSFTFTESRCSPELWGKLADWYTGWNSDGSMVEYLCHAVEDLEAEGVVDEVEARDLRAEIDSYVNPIESPDHFSYLTSWALISGAYPQDLVEGGLHAHAAFRLRFVNWKAGRPLGPLSWAQNDLPAVHLIKPEEVTHA